MATNNLLRCGINFSSKFDSNMKLKDFSDKEPRICMKLSNLLSTEMLQIMASLAHIKGFFRVDSFKRDEICKGGKSFLFYMMQHQCTLGQLIQLMEGKEFNGVFRLLSVYEQLCIMKQPNSSVLVLQGGKLNLDFVVKGIPYPDYQWYFNELLIEGANDSTLQLEDMQKYDEGTYHCVAYQEMSKNLQNMVTSLKTKCSVSIKCPMLKTNLPKVQKVYKGASVTLYVELEDSVFGSYEWIRNNDILTYATENILQIDNFDEKNVGKYKCFIKNDGGSIYSDECSLEILDCSFVEPLESRQITPFQPSKKVALLLGNSNYLNYSDLTSPVNDIEMVKNTLQKIKDLSIVLCSTDVSREETCHLLETFYGHVQKNSFVFFYYTGHGFTIDSNNYIVPVDCPPSGNFQISDCVNYASIKKSVFKNKPKLLVTILDMCLAVPNKEENPQLYQNGSSLDTDCVYNSSCSYIEASPTSTYQKTYENKNENTSFYCRCICKYLGNNASIKKNLENAHIQFDVENNCNQKPSLCSNENKGYNFYSPVK